MEKLIPIKEVEKVLAKRQADLYDEVHPSSAVQFISIEEVGVDGRRYQMTRSAQRLFAQKLQIPLDYLSRCPQNLQEGEKVVESWDGGKTMFSIINAYTSAANRPELLLEDVYRLQRIGGIILSLVK